MTPSSRPPAISEFARWLRQRQELGVSKIVLEELDEAQVASLVEHGLRARPEETAAPPAPAGTEPALAPPAPPPEPKREPPVTEGRVRQAAALTDLPGDHDELRELCMGCTRCGLSETRNQVVFHDGTPDARVMVVGEGPGANEDRTGLPFVGRAGRYLDLLLASVGLSREASVYICNVVKCRPPGNRNPRPEEIEACSPYLKRQIEIVRPEAILAVGTFSAQLLTDSSIPLGRLRGEIHAWEGIPLIVTYHPAALLRNSGWVQPTWEDLQLLRQILDGPVPHGD